MSFENIKSDKCRCVIGKYIFLYMDTTYIIQINNVKSKVRTRYKISSISEFSSQYFDLDMLQTNIKDCTVHFTILTKLTKHFYLLPLTFFVMLISRRPLGVIFTVNASVPRD
jgi:hypothetical protein